MNNNYQNLLWAIFLLLAAFIFSARLPAYIGLFVFLGFFVLSVGLFHKFFTMGRKPPEDE